MRHHWTLRWSLYPNASRMSAFQLRMTENRKAHDESRQESDRRKGPAILSEGGVLPSRGCEERALALPPVT